MAVKFYTEVTVTSKSFESPGANHGNQSSFPISIMNQLNREKRIFAYYPLMLISKQYDCTSKWAFANLKGEARRSGTAHCFQRV